MTDIPLGDLALNFGVSALAVLVFIAVVMAVAIRMNNHSIIDICWGPGFAVVAVVSYLTSIGSDGNDLRRLVVLALTVVWGMRLSLYIGFRNRGHGQDKRYTALLKHQQGPLVPFLIRKIYGLQAFSFSWCRCPSSSRCTSFAPSESSARSASRSGPSASSSNRLETTNFPASKLIRPMPGR